MKKVKKEIVEELFKNPAENQDFFVQWIKAFSCFPERVFYLIIYFFYFILFMIVIKKIEFIRIEIFKKFKR